MEHSDDLNLHLAQFDWPERWSANDVFDLQVTLEIRYQKFIGRGTANSEEDAFVKAGAEALERAITFGNDIHSTGVAVHVEDIAAQRNALLELNERAAFFGHFFTATPFIAIDVSELNMRFAAVFKKLASLKIDLNFFSSINISGTHAYLCVATGKSAALPWGGAIGLSAKENKDEAVQAAFFECIRAAAAISDHGPLSRMTLADFRKINKPTAEDRQGLAQNLDYWNSISNLFPNAGERAGVRIDIERSAVPNKLERLQCPFDEIKSAPVIAYRASPITGVDLNSLYEKSDEPTLKWLSEFFGAKISTDQVLMRPHFLG